MARTLNAGNATDKAPGAGHNSEERQKIINEVCNELDKLETKIDAIETKAKADKEPLKKKIKEHRSRIQGLDILLVDFDAIRRLRDLEDDDLTASIKSIRELFLALGMGEQGSLLPGLEDAEAPGGDPGHLGTQAGLNGEDGDANPFPPGQQHDQWKSGWVSGQEQLADGRA